jgi:hypothetical protein
MILAARHLDSPKAGQMRRQELGVKQLKAPRSQPMAQEGQRDL